jgi:hypothetical protein
MGLTNWLKPTDIGHWEMNPETGIARRTGKAGVDRARNLCGLPLAPQGHRQ